MTATNDQVLTGYAGTDTVSTFMISVTNNLVGGATAPFVIVGGFPKDKKLVYWKITPVASNNFTIGAMQTVSTNFSHRKSFGTHSAIGNGVDTLSRRNNIRCARFAS